MLANGPLLSVENPEDRTLVEQATEKPSERSIDENIHILNTGAKHVGIFLTKATEFHHKYPEMRFWFFVEFD